MFGDAFDDAGGVAFDVEDVVFGVGDDDLAAEGGAAGAGDAPAEGLEESAEDGFVFGFVQEEFFYFFEVENVVLLLLDGGVGFVFDTLSVDI